jgi:DNA polymerase elongation subunit (family B)
MMPAAKLDSFDMLLYIDIETFSENGFRSDCTKVISIQYRNFDGRTKVLKEWESSEKNILSSFLTDLKMMRNEGFLILVGHNILRFDVPTLIRRMAANGIDGHGNLEDFFSNIATVDTLQCMLPFNGMRFKGLNSDDVSSRLDIPGPNHRNTEVESFYRNKEFKKIEDHAVADLDFVQSLYWRLKREEVGTLTDATKNLYSNM